MSADPEALPAYAYVPGGPYPHPTSSPRGHSAGRIGPTAEPIAADDWPASPLYRRGIALFNAGYYWEAHEAWEALWHAHGRRGPTADLLKALIKLAAAGVKVRERQPRGAATHLRRAAELFESVLASTGPRHLGLDLREWAELARSTAEAPPHDPEPPGTPVVRVFPFHLDPG